MKREVFFKSIDMNYNPTNGRELALLCDLQEMTASKKNEDPEFYKNVILICWNKLQEIAGIKDENGEFILNEINIPAIDYKTKEVTYTERERDIIRSEIF